MAEPKTVLVLGGGVGGLVAASRLRKRLPSEHRVVLIEREAQFTFQPSLLWLMIGRRRREQIRRPLAALERQGIELVRGDIERIDPETGKSASFNGRGECFLETGDGRAGYGSGNFFAEPAPRVKLHRPGRTLHLGKVAFEKYWLFRWF